MAFGEPLTQPAALRASDRTFGSKPALPIPCWLSPKPSTEKRSLHPHSERIATISRSFASCIGAGRCASRWPSYGTSAVRCPATLRPFAKCGQSMCERYFRSRDRPNRRQAPQRNEPRAAQRVSTGFTQVEPNKASLGSAPVRVSACATLPFYPQQQTCGSLALLVWRLGLVHNPAKSMNRRDREVRCQPQSDGADFAIVTLGKERQEPLQHGLRRLLGEVVAAVDGAARHLGRAVLPPDCRRVVPLADFALASPQHQHRALHFLSGDAAGAVVLEIDGGGGPIVLAHAADHVRVVD